MMTQKELRDLKNNALALRNIASKVLEQVEREEKKVPVLPTKTRQSKKSITTVDLIERIHTNRRKPVTVR